MSVCSLIPTITIHQWNSVCFYFRTKQHLHTLAVHIIAIMPKMQVIVISCWVMPTTNLFVYNILSIPTQHVANDSFNIDSTHNIIMFKCLMSPRNWHQPYNLKYVNPQAHGLDIHTVSVWAHGSSTCNLEISRKMFMKGGRIHRWLSSLIRHSSSTKRYVEIVSCVEKLNNSSTQCPRRTGI